MIESVISLVQQSCLIAAGSNISGFITDVDFAFYQSTMFKEVDITTSSDKNSLIRARALISPAAHSVQQIGDALLSICNYIGFNHFTASSIKWYREATVLRFVTAASETLYVTGTVVASGPKYPRLVERYDQDFGNLSGPLKPYPGGLPDWAK